MHASAKGLCPLINHSIEQHNGSEMFQKVDESGRLTSADRFGWSYVL